MKLLKKSKKFLNVAQGVIERIVSKPEWDSDHGGNATLPLGSTSGAVLDVLLFFQANPNKNFRLVQGEGSSCTILDEKTGIDFTAIVSKMFIFNGL
jgi:hypothetical protein